MAVFVGEGVSVRVGDGVTVGVDEGVLVGMAVGLEVVVGVLIVPVLHADENKTITIEIPIIHILSFIVTPLLILSWDYNRNPGHGLVDNLPASGARDPFSSLGGGMQKKPRELRLFFRAPFITKKILSLC